MSETLISTNSVETLIEEVEHHWSYNDAATLPQNVIDEISVRPEWTIDLVLQLKRCDPVTNERHSEILLSLINESLYQIRYGLDRKDKKATLLLDETQEILNQVIGFLPEKFKIALNEIIFDAKLPIEIQLEEDNNEYEPKIDIAPRLPELLEQLRREKVCKNAFELYEFMLSQIYSKPSMVQLSIIAELAHSKKLIAHEVAVLMLLHPKPLIRKKVAFLLYELSDECVFTPVDLRRLIMLRNWVPVDERGNLDTLIAHLRKNKLSPAPYPPAKLSRLVGSSMDGAGVSCIVAEFKKNNQRQVGGFLVKIDVGIRDPWIMHKAPKHYLNQMLEEQKKNGLPMKPVSVAYVNKIVQHFLSVSLKSNLVPEPTFIQMAEMFGATDWQPQPMTWSDEINRLREKCSDCLSESFIIASLQCSGDWHLKQDIANSWFETGEIAEQAFIEAKNKHATDTSQSLKDVGVKCLMDKCLEKWKTIFLVTCLWMRSKERHQYCNDLFTVLHCLDENWTPSSIPLICNVTTQTVATIIRREEKIL